MVKTKKHKIRRRRVVRSRKIYKGGGIDISILDWFTPDLYNYVYNQYIKLPKEFDYYFTNLLHTYPAHYLDYEGCTVQATIDRYTPNHCKQKYNDEYPKIGQMSSCHIMLIILIFRLNFYDMFHKQVKGWTEIGQKIGREKFFLKERLGFFNKGNKTYENLIKEKEQFCIDSAKEIKDEIYKVKQNQKYDEIKKENQPYAKPDYSMGSAPPDEDLAPLTKEDLAPLTTIGEEGDEGEEGGRKSRRRHAKKRKYTRRGRRPPLRKGRTQNK